MRYRVLCTDYDGTLARHGVIPDAARASLERLRASGRHALLVTGRTITDLQSVCPRLDLFRCVIAENGAVLYWPATGRREMLGAAPPGRFVASLRRRGVSPLGRGQIVVATSGPHEAAVLEAIREAGLALQVIRNRDAVMVLPAGTDKGTGLRRSLAMLGLSPSASVAIGDAENDLASFRACACSVAVANALPLVQAEADFVTAGAASEGVCQLIAELLAQEPGSNATR